MDHQVDAFLQTFIWLYLAVFHAFLVRFLSLIGFVGFTAMMKQIRNVMANRAYVFGYAIDFSQGFPNSCYGFPCRLKSSNPSGNGEGINNTPT
tara:strand:- start:161 stop:439 length:279 start_codon:yes stop_codon:yes gene_type:complete